VVYFSESPSNLGIAGFIVLTGSFFHTQTHVSFYITGELSPNMRMIPKSILLNPAKVALRAPLLLSQFHLSLLTGSIHKA
jgi:hypothetical protein